MMNTEEKFKDNWQYIFPISKWDAQPWPPKYT